MKAGAPGKPKKLLIVRFGTKFVHAEFAGGLDFFEPCGDGCGVEFGAAAADFGAEDVEIMDVAKEILHPF